MEKINETFKTMKIASCIAPVNLAIIKYWGKRDENLILPLNDSISMTLSTKHMFAKTTVMISPMFNENRFWLNGKEEIFDNKRLINCLTEVKKQSNLNELKNWKIHICSENNFPTAAGLASSAAGYACLVVALSQLYEINCDLSVIARQGSGSACRSIYGGWVQWFKGTNSSGIDSIAKQIAPVNHWPNIKILILVVNDKKKQYSSSTGMRTSVETSELLKYRCENIVPKHIHLMLEAINEKCFSKFAELTMKDSNSFHAICLDTYPPCIYMNSTSHKIINMVHSYNIFYGKLKLAYTFDAGANACLICQNDDIEEICSLINFIFPTTLSMSDYIKGNSINLKNLNQQLIDYFQKQVNEPDNLQYIISTEIGDGPQIINDHLLSDSGIPK